MTNRREVAMWKFATEYNVTTGEAIKEGDSCHWLSTLVFSLPGWSVLLLSKVDGRSLGLKTESESSANTTTASQQAEVATRV